MNMMHDYISKLLYEERATQLRNEAATHRLARSISKITKRAQRTRGRPAAVQPVRVPRQREQRSLPARSTADDSAHAAPSYDRAA